MKHLVLDVHLSSKTLGSGLRGRGFKVSTLQDLGLADIALDSEVVKRVDQLVEGDWVLVTMDLSILEDSPGFDWDRYPIAWITTRPELRGGEVEAAKHDVVHRYADRIAEQDAGEHFTYSQHRFFRHPPSLVSRPY